MVEATSRRGETAIGFRVASDPHALAAGYGVHPNPDKRERLTLGAHDSIIVLAENT